MHAEDDHPEEISREIFDHLVRLAAFELSEEEAEYLRTELNDQLKAVHELEAIALEEDMPITSHGVPYSDAIRAGLRSDEILPCEEAEDILAQAPEIEDRFVIVPDIPSSELE